MRLKKMIVDGEWDVAHKLLTKLLPKNDVRRFLYHLYREEYLELLGSSEYQLALAFLRTRLKPLEDIADSQGRDEFKELCYLLSCKSVAESDTFRYSMNLVVV
jgi:hypothetical protein